MNLQHTPIEEQSPAQLWGGIVIPPMFFAIFIAGICMSTHDAGWSYTVKAGGVVLFCWVLPWMVALPRIEELAKRRAFPIYTRPWLRAAITTTILELASAGLLIGAVVIGRKLEILSP